MKRALELFGRHLSYLRPSALKPALIGVPGIMFLLLLGSAGCDLKADAQTTPLPQDAAPGSPGEIGADVNAPPSSDVEEPGTGLPAMDLPDAAPLDQDISPPMQPDNPAPAPSPAPPPEAPELDPAPSPESSQNLLPDERTSPRGFTQESAENGNNDNPTGEKDSDAASPAAPEPTNTPTKPDEQPAEREPERAPRGGSGSNTPPDFIKKGRPKLV